MKFLRPKQQAPRSRATVLLGLLCIALLLFGAAVQTIHTHQDGTVHSDCALCVNGHVVLAVVACLALFLLLQVIVPFSHDIPELFRSVSIPFALWSRPPPDTAAFA